jgi:RNA polymerase sigma factor for flagellar operon FliA
MNDALWRAHAARDASAREQLLAEHLGLVHHVARQLSRTLAVKADFDELVSAGAIGLMASLDSFEPERGLAFSTFAAPRIRGAILDELRRQDHVPRSVRRKTREIARAARRSRAAWTARPTTPRWPSTSAWTAGRSGAGRPTSRARTTCRSTAPRATASRVPGPVDVLTDESQEGADERVNREQETSFLREAILGLKEQERVVLSLYYFEELKAARDRHDPRPHRVARLADSLRGARQAAHGAPPAARAGGVSPRPPRVGRASRGAMADARRTETRRLRDPAATTHRQRDTVGADDLARAAAKARIDRP